MSKNLIISTFLLLAAVNQSAFAFPGDNRPGQGRPGDGRPGDNRPGPGHDRPGDNRPGPGQDRPGDNRPGPGHDRPGDNRPGPGQDRPGDNRPGPGHDRPGDNRPGPGQDRPGDNRPGSGRVVFQTLEKYTVQKIVETTNVTRVNMPNVKIIQLTARDNDVEIVEARAQLDDGREIFMDGLTGGLKEDHTAAYTLDNGRGIRIQSITVRAVTRGLSGSRADLEVAVGVAQ